MSGKAKSIEARFWPKVKKTSSCWLWLAHKNNKGYGMIGVKKTMRLAHRVAYEIVIGTIPEGMCLLHSCDNRLCVNPSHLSVGSVKDNNLDMIKKGRDNKAHGTSVGISKLNDTDVSQARVLYRNGGHTWRSLAQLFGVSHSVIGKALKGVTWKHVCV